MLRSSPHPCFTHIKVQWHVEEDFAHQATLIPVSRWQVYLITELLTGGELLDSLLQRGSYNEADARGCFVQLLRGIEYLHAK